MMASDIQVSAAQAPRKTPRVAAAPASKPQAPAMVGDALRVSQPAKAELKPAKKLPSPAASAKVPGEDVRNGLSIAGSVAGPVVTAQQSVGMLANASFKSPLLTKAAEFVSRTASSLGKLPLFRSAALGTGLKWVGRCLPFLGAGILCFDGYAAFKTLSNPEASGMRKGLALGRFISNAIATGVSFIPGAGMVYSIIPALIGNGFEFAMMKLNASEAAKQ